MESCAGFGRSVLSPKSESLTVNYPRQGTDSLNMTRARLNLVSLLIMITVLGVVAALGSPARVY